MKLICPACGAVASAEVWVTNENMEQALGLADKLASSTGSRVLTYVAMFRPQVSGNPKGYRGMAWSRVLKILRTLEEELKATHIEWDRKPARPINASLWGQAIETMRHLKNIRLPLKSHGYLKSVAYGIADNLDRRKEVQRNQTERNGNWRKKVKQISNYNKIPVCASCGMQADNIEPGKPCPYCPDIA